MLKKEYKDISEFIDDIHEEVDLRDLIVDLGIIKDESEFHGQFIRCIFHDNDDTPSLQIGEHFFRCYACGVKGDVIKFIMLYFNIDFIQACVKLAEILNVDLQSVKYKYNEKYDKLQKEWDNYLNAMENASKEIKQLQRDYFPQEIGYDSKINYIVLPITSKTGAILGFTKRRVNDEIEFVEYESGRKIKRPKWKHSSLNNSLIGQCHNIFNLSIASPEIVKTKKIITTEGPKDVIAYRKIGKNNTICCCGTSNSNNIWDILLPADEIILSFDLDEAGITATIKTTEYLSTIFDIKNITTVVLPNSKDPYDVVTLDNGIKELENYYNNRIPVINFIIKHGTAKDINNIYNNVEEFNKMFIIKSLCKLKCFSSGEAISYIESGSDKANKEKKLDNKNENIRNSEKEKLISIINGESNNGYKELDSDPLKAIDKAKKMLKLKYGIIE